MELNKFFERMGVKFQYVERKTDGFSIDVRKIKGGEECFILEANPNVEALVIQVQPEDRHLLLQVSEPPARLHAEPKKHKFLCGHDERAWFVAAVPGMSVRDVHTAKEALKPTVVKASQEAVGLKRKHMGKRKTLAYLRQGEWFFVPMPDYFNPPADRVLKDEPVQRSGSKPHTCQFLYRVNGITVYTCYKFPQGLTQLQYDEHIHKFPEDKKLPWRTMLRDPQVCAKGKITHSDHKTLVLDGWYRVIPSTEANAPSRRNLRFLD